MTEANDQSHVEVEGQVENKIAQKFRAAREETMKESQSLSEIYRSITKPGFKDVYGAWVKNMDTVAKTYSWGKDTPGFRTRLMKIQNRVVGAASAGFLIPADFVIDTLTLPFRKLPIAKQTIGHFIPTHMLGQHSIRASEKARNEALFWRGVGQVARVGEIPFAVVGEVFKRGVVHGLPLNEGRAFVQYVGEKSKAVTQAILHPKPKTV